MAKVWDDASSWRRIHFQYGSAYGERYQAMCPHIAQSYRHCRLGDMPFYITTRAPPIWKMGWLATFLARTTPLVLHLIANCRFDFFSPENIIFVYGPGLTSSSSRRLNMRDWQPNFLAHLTVAQPVDALMRPWWLHTWKSMQADRNFAYFPRKLISFYEDNWYGNGRCLWILATFQYRSFSV